MEEKEQSGKWEHHKQLVAVGGSMCIAEWTEGEEEGRAEYCQQHDPPRSGGVN